MKNNPHNHSNETPKTSKRRLMVGVIGGSRVEPQIENLARKLGRGIAERGYILVCGGLGGVMEAACRGALEAGGVTVGILPGDSRGSANPYVSIPVVTAMSHARNAVIVRTADILVAVDGRYGTLSEIALARAVGKRVLGLYTWEDIPGVEAKSSVGEVLREVSAYESGSPAGL